LRTGQIKGRGEELWLLSGAVAALVGAALALQLIKYSHCRYFACVWRATGTDTKRVIWTPDQDLLVCPYKS
jgi:hypothetical protein